MYVVRDARGRAVARARTAEAAHRASRRSGRGGAVDLNRVAGDAEKVAEIEGVVEKYLGILGATDLSRPRIALRSNLGSRWLARDVWRASRPTETTIEVQRSVVGDPRTLERVVAHEVIHHVDFVLHGFSGRGHGRFFRELAERVNAAMGPCFVTEVSDQEYAEAATCRPYLLVVVPVGDRFGYAWGVRLSPDGAAWLRRQVEGRGARTAYSTDPRWTSGARIKRFGGASIPRSAEDQAKLRAVYESAGVALAG